MICYAPDTLEDALNEMFRLADDLNAMKLGALSPGFYMNQHLHKLIDQFLPKDMVDPKYDLYVSVTRQRDRTNHMVGEFTDREFLINSLLASCYIPMYSNGYYAEPPKLNNEVSKKKARVEIAQWLTALFINRKAWVLSFFLDWYKFLDCR